MGEEFSPEGAANNAAELLARVLSTQKLNRQVNAILTGAVFVLLAGLGWAFKDELQLWRDAQNSISSTLTNHIAAEIQHRGEVSDAIQAVDKRSSDGLQSLEKRVLTMETDRTVRIRDAEQQFRDIINRLDALDKSVSTLTLNVNGLQILSRSGARTPYYQFGPSGGPR